MTTAAAFDQIEKAQSLSQRLTHGDRLLIFLCVYKNTVLRLSEFGWAFLFLGFQ